MSEIPLLFEKRDDGVAVVSTNDDPLNRTLGSPDANEGIQAFLEKRKPIFNR